MEQSENNIHPVINFLNYAGIKGTWMIDFDWGMSQLHQFVALNSTLDQKGDLLTYFNEFKKNSLRSNLIDFKTGSMSMLGNVDEAQEYTVDNAIAHIRLSGPMFLEDGLCHYGMNTFASNLRMLNSMRSIKGVILSVNSGGGEVLAAQKVYTAVSEFSKPLVAHVEMAASAAYMGILGADRIIGEGTISAAGSIGAMASIRKDLIKAISEQYDDVYSDLSPSKNKNLKDYIAGDDTGIKESLNTLAADFQSKVKQHRPIGYKETQTLEGGMFIGLDAKKRGLLDSIGGFDFAMKQLIKLIK